MNLLIDTNILLHSVHRESPHHEATRDFVDIRRQTTGFCTTWSILYEWLRVATHAKVFSKPLDPGLAADFVSTLASDPKVDILVQTANHRRFFDEVLLDAPPLRGNIYHDVHTAALMREHGIKTIATADRHFRLFSSIKVIDPTAA